LHWQLLKQNPSEMLLHATHKLFAMPQKNRKQKATKNEKRTKQKRIVANLIPSSTQNKL